MTEAEDKSQRTEMPTAKKLEETREKGQLPISQEVKFATMIGASLLVIVLGAEYMANGLMNMLQPFIARAHEIKMTPEGLGQLIGNLLGDLLQLLALVFIIMIPAAIAGTWLQTGAFMSWNVLSFNFEKLNPIEGFKRFFGLQAVVDLLKSLIKFSVIGTLSYYLLKPIFELSPTLVGLEPAQFVHQLDVATIHIAGSILLVVIFIAIADYMYTRWDYIEKLKMTPAEVRDESRQSEGDPRVRSKLRQVRQQRAKRRMMAKVPEATVVITNPTHFAVALLYDRQRHEAPLLVAKGVDSLAQRIRDLAVVHRVPIVENPPLARALYATVDLDEEIPADHYRAVAEIVSYVYRLRDRQRTT